MNFNECYQNVLLNEYTGCLKIGVHLATDSSTKKKIIFSYEHGSKNASLRELRPPKGGPKKYLFFNYFEDVQT